MIKKYIKYRKLIILILLFISIPKINCQVKKENSLYNWFDETIGRENLSINNGILYIDYYNTKKTESCFLKSKSFEKGSVNYDGQAYFDLHINYDIYKDNVIFETNSIKNKALITLIRDKIDSFIFDGKEFQNLKIQNEKKPDFIAGFYESSFSTKDFELFIKYSKSRRDVVIDDKIFVEFDLKNNFILKKQKIFYQIDSKSDFLKLFPNFKKNINEYYDLNYKLEKSDKVSFIQSLLKFINNTIVSP